MHVGVPVSRHVFGAAMTSLPHTLVVTPQDWQFWYVVVQLPVDVQEDTESHIWLSWHTLLVNVAMPVKDGTL